MALDQRSPFELRIWHFYTEEEKSITLLNAYKQRVLFSEDIKSLLLKDRLNTWSYWGFPAACYALFHYTGALQPYIATKYSLSTQRLIPAAISGILWLGWLHFNPFYNALQNEKLHLLNLIEKRVGLNMKALNEQVPRTWTTQEIHRQIRESYNNRHGFFTNILYPSEERASPLQDISSYPFKYRRDKIVK
ncbi:unnamed protein product [Paramecium primaurelia]|uniref:Transmembrane protein n=1 Tax=Paramecium primaurelia TaxID=5886 RepID=A0A8S1M911_PARPR|nr:unnamed protein product [Paramecium primaurelia]